MLIKIKKTKTVTMNYDNIDHGVWLDVTYNNEAGTIFNDFAVFIPMSKVYQVTRGLISATQRFYRKK